MKHLPWKPVLDGMAIEEEPVGVSGSSCNYPSVFIQVLPFSQRTIDLARKKGGLEIISIREKTTVPAGTFDTVHYVRNTQSVDEYWKSTLHGVIVKHIGKVHGITVTETLTSSR